MKEVSIDSLKEVMESNDMVNVFNFLEEGSRMSNITVRNLCHEVSQCRSIDMWFKVKDLNMAIESYYNTTCAFELIERMRADCGMDVKEEPSDPS